MTTSAQSRVAQATARPASTGPEATRQRAWRRARWVAALLAIGALGLTVDLALAGHTEGKELVGLATAAGAVVTAVLSLAGLGLRSPRTARRGALALLYAMWVGIAVLGLVGFNSHRAPVTADSVDQRPRPPLAPLVFTGLGIAGAATLRFGTRKPNGA